jgi:large subunit ribosomal protein L30
MIHITLSRSLIGRPGDQIATVKALGLHKIGDYKSVVDNVATRGMINKVKFLLQVKELAQAETQVEVPPETQLEVKE